MFYIKSATTTSFSKTRHPSGQSHTYFNLQISWVWPLH